MIQTMPSPFPQADRPAATEGDAVSLPVYVQQWHWAYLALGGMLLLGVPFLLALAEPTLRPCMVPLIGGVGAACCFVSRRRRRQLRYVTLESDGLRLASEAMRARGSDCFIPWAEVKLMRFAPHVPHAPDEPPLLEGIEVVTADRRHYFVITPDTQEPERYRHLLFERAQRAFATDPRTGEVTPPRDPEAFADAETARALAELPIQRFRRFALWGTVAAACLPALLAVFVHLLFGPFGGEAFWPVFWTTLPLVALAALAVYAGNRRLKRLRDAWRNVVNSSPPPQP